LAFVLFATTLAIMINPVLAINSPKQSPLQTPVSARNRKALGLSSFYDPGEPENEGFARKWVS
jgi:hypothetical protein